MRHNEENYSTLAFGIAMFFDVPQRHRKGTVLITSDHFELAKSPFRKPQSSDS